MKWLMSVWISFFIATAFAGSAVHLELHEASMVEVLKWLARERHHALILSPRVQGTISLSLQGEVGDALLKAVLKAENLSLREVGSTWYIMPLNEEADHLADQLKWRSLQEASAPLKTVVCVMKYAKAEALAKLLGTTKADFFSPRGTIMVDERTNALILTDVANRLPRVMQLLKTLDIAVPQLMVTALLVSVDEDAMRDLGIDFTKVSPGGAALAGGNLRFVLAKLSDKARLEVKLKALQETNRAELISNPHLFTSNQQPAIIEAGEEVPYQETSESGGTAVVFKKAVLGLQVTPQVLPGRRILLHLLFNQDRPSATIIAGVPSINTRHIQTNVVVPAGQTVILGGIYEEAGENKKQSIPGLNALPIIGSLLSMQSVRHKKRELLIFVTPTMHE